MKRFSHKDLILTLGVLVALIIVLAAIYLKETPLLNDNTSEYEKHQKKIEPSVIIQKFITRAASSLHL